jgi:hypothetical protein
MEREYLQMSAQSIADMREDKVLASGEKGQFQAG